MPQKQRATVTQLPETARQRFQRLAKKRMLAAIKRISLLAPLTDRGRYEFTDEEAAQMVARLRAEVDQIEELLKDRRRKQPTFDFE